MIGAPRGKCATYPVYVYDPERRRKIYVGSGLTIEHAREIETQAEQSDGSPAKIGAASGYVVNEISGCWLWQDSLNPAGYGRLFDGERHLSAHRVVYEQNKGPIPEGLELDHLCCNPRCVNPEHLEPVETAENVRRSFAARRRMVRVRP